MTENPYQPPTAPLEKPWSQADQASTPPNVVVAARLLWASIALAIASICAATVGWIELPGGKPYSAGEVVAQGFGVALTILLIRKFSDRRNWARWVFAIICGLDAALTAYSVIVAFDFWRTTSLLLRATGIVQFTLSIIAVILLFSRQANIWFASSRDA